MRTASIVSAGRLCSCWGAVSSLSAGFFVGGASDGPPSQLRFLREVGTVHPVEVLAPLGSDPSSDTVMTLSSSLSEETPNRPVDSLLGVPHGRPPSSSGRGTALASFVGEAGYPPRPLRQVMGTADCQFPPAVELQEVTEVPRAWASPKREARQ